MRIPKMVLFDYGNTIITEERLGFEKGNAALLEIAVKNPKNVTVEEIRSKADEVIGDIPKRMNTTHFRQPLELVWNSVNKYVYEYFGIEFDRPYEELQMIFWNSAVRPYPSENIDSTLDFLYKNGIRTGVVSNIMFSGKTLERRINECMPNHHFEFIIASSEYVYRKPESQIFELALIKSGLKAEEVWFCGDNPICDIEGALNTGIQPVWYKKTYCPTEETEKALKNIPSEKYLGINNWSELKDIILSLKK